MHRLLSQIAMILGVLLLLVVAIGDARCEDYKSKTFPPLNILEKYISKQKSGRRINIIGKFKKDGDQYELYYSYNDGGSPSNVIVSSITLIHLDTDVWIIPGNWTGVLQK